jgi:short-subunit dehydrogenase
VKGYFDGKVVLLTGAAQGLGRQLALELAALDTRLILIDADVEALMALRETLRTLGANVHTHAVDVTDRDAMVTMQQELPEGFAAVDVVISNAGIAGMAFPDQPSAATAGRIMAVNYLGLVHLTELFLPAMLERRSGHFAGIASLAGLRGLPLGGYYAASKAAQRLFLDCLRTDLVGSGVAVTIVLPGLIDTGMNSDIKRVFRLPRMMPASIAARKILQAVARRKRHYLFPFEAALLARLDVLLPHFLRDRLLSLPWFWQKGQVIRSRAALGESPARSAKSAPKGTSAKETDKTSGAA